MTTANFMEGCYLVMKSRLSGLVLDVAGDSVAGAELVMATRDPGNVNQIWFEDQVTGTIRSKSNHLCLTINGNNVLQHVFNSKILLRANTSIWTLGSVEGRTPCYKGLIFAKRKTRFVRFNYNITFIYEERGKSGETP